eukprot:5929566-Ditylum_brightwellii.AAC.1
MGVYMLPSLSGTIHFLIHFVTPEMPAECWTILECRQYLKFFVLPSGKTALDARKKPAEFYHNSSVCKVPPEKRVGNAEHVEK